jgi:Fe-S-cluster-containing dehydrogenase component
MTKQYGLVFDLRRCIGCSTCVVACKAENNLENRNWMELLNFSGLPADVPSGKYPDLKLAWKPVTCMHCQKPSCLEACPENAIVKRPDGVVLIDKKKCTGCNLCASACPYDVIKFNEHENVVEKCTLCSHRIDEGLEPFCVKECIWGAIRFGDVSDPESEVSKLVRKRKGHTERAEAGTVPSNYYLDPY